MVDIIADFMAAEKLGAALITAFGVTAFVVSAFFYLGRNRYRSIILPLILFGFLQLSFGSVALMEADDLRAHLIELHDKQPNVFKSEEIDRIQDLLADHQFVKASSIALMVVGWGLIIYRKRQDPSAGVGIGLVIESLICLVLVLFAEARAASYLASLELFQP